MRRDRLIIYMELSISMVIAIAIGWTAMAAGGDISSGRNRAVVFGIVVAWATLEFLPIVLHMARFGADSLAVTMATARLSLINYFGAMSMSMGGLVAVPLWYFHGSRAFLALACGSATFFLMREAWWAYDDLTRAGKIVVAATIIFLAVAITFLVVSF